MNLEQIEGYLADFDGRPVSVTMPIRGTVCVLFIGKLQITHDWDNHIIAYRVGDVGPSVVFQAKDVESIAVNEALTAASVVLKSDAPMEKSRLTNV